MNTTSNVINILKKNKDLHENTNRKQINFRYKFISNQLELSRRQILTLVILFQTKSIKDTYKCQNQPLTSLYVHTTNNNNCKP